ncbi:MAG TPA: ethanolamine ammonia-lyase reactivating factor EutA [Stellaceae bacterium]
MSNKDEDMHDTEFEHEHFGETLSEEQRAQLAAFIWSQEHVELKTVGIDIGSSTSHLLFAKVVLQRQSEGLSARFVVVDRQVLWRSPIMLTPFLPDGLIDAQALKVFIDKSYKEAGFERTDVDSGAVILTGEAIKRKNARAIDELFADEAGKFVCATAGHILECRLAAHGSGAVKLSRDRSQCVLHVDIGGGTTKLTLIEKGTPVSSAAFAVGGRLVATDDQGKWTRIDDSARLTAEDLGFAAAPESFADPEKREATAQRLAKVAADYVLGAKLDPLGQKLLLTEPLRRTVEPTALTFSGGVSEYIFGTEPQEYGDIAMPLARAMIKQLTTRAKLPLIDPGQRIRATVIGASQFTIQVSGKTIYLSDPSILPVHGVPVMHVGRIAEDHPEKLAEAIRQGFIGLDLEADGRAAIAFSWQGDPSYERLAATGNAIVAAVSRKRSEPLFLMIDGDIGRTMGRLLHEELGLPGPLVSIDGVQLQDLDYVDVGELMSPPGVVPVVIKSLLFS